MFITLFITFAETIMPCIQRLKLKLALNMLRKKLLVQLSLAALMLVPQTMKAQFNWPYKNVNGTLVT